jgi:putative polyketide hydroxylase
MSESDEAKVLIVGGALSGLSTAVFLAWHGVKSLVIEKHPDTLSHPRARGINPRTAEIYRQVGLESALWAETHIADFSKLLMLRAETIAGPEIFSGPTDQPDPTGEVSPCEWVPIDQDRLEHLLRDKAIELGAEIRFNTELVSFSQHADGVDVVVDDRTTGTRKTIRASYVVGADGHRSPVRTALGVTPQGPGEFATALSLLFDADLTEALRGRPIGMAYLDQPAPQTILYAADGDKRWVFATAQPPGTTLDDLSDEDYVAMVRAGIGQPDLDVEIIPQLPAGGVKALNFYVGGQVAERYQVDRVFLVGDAAHLVPPTGGFGASLGIQDAHNLAWKLAAVLNGIADPALLHTYAAERAPVAWMTLQQTLAMMQERTGDGDPAEQDASAAYAAAVFGYRYTQGAPVPPPELNAEPGTRAPHYVLGENSTLDLYGRSIVVLAGEAGQDWVEAAKKLADRNNLPIEAVRVGGDIADPAGKFATAHGITPGGVVVVRPDGFVAYRSAKPVEDADTELATALGTLLARSDIA